MSKAKIRLVFVLLLFVAGGAIVSLPAQAVPITGTIVLPGSITTSGSSYAQNYAGDSTVTVTYTIAGTTDANGNVVFDPTGSKVTFTDSNYNWTTLPISITSVVGDLENDQITSFKFSSTDWYPDAASEGIINNGLSGTINQDKTGKIDASYKDTDGNVYNYHFSAVPEPASLLLFGIGVFGLIGYTGWRRKTVVKS